MLPLFAFGLMRDHRAEELNFTQEVEKYRRMIAALDKGNAKQAAEAIGCIAAGFAAQIRVDRGKSARSGPTKKKAES